MDGINVYAQPQSTVADGRSPALVWTHSGNSEALVAVQLVSETLVAVHRVYKTLWNTGSSSVGP